MLLRPIGVAVLSCIGLTVHANDLVQNGGFEAGTGIDGLPTNWKTYQPFAGPKVKLADDQKHGGANSLLIQTSPDSVAFAMSEPIAVAPGEKIRLSAWCKAQEMSTSGTGSFGIAAGWMDFTRTYLEQATYQTVPIQANRDWFEITTETVVPERARYFTFQVRHRAVTGKSWWDDITVTPASSVALRLGLTSPRIEPGHTTVPATLINRDAKLAGSSLKLRTQPGGGEQQVTVGRDVETSVVLAFNVQSRGAQTLSVDVLDPEGKQPLFSTSNKVTVPDHMIMEPVLPCYLCVEDSEPTIEDRIWVHEPDELRAKLTLSCELRRAGDPKSAKPIASFELPHPQVENRVSFKLPPLQQLGKGDYVINAGLMQGAKSLDYGTQDWHVISRAQSQTTLSPDGYPIVNGKKTFAMGLYNGTDFPELAAAGLNVTQNFDVGHVRRGYLPDNQRMKRMLDDAMKVGMTHLFLVSHGPGCRALDDEYLRRLRMFKNHPGVFMWYEEEGVARGDMPLSFLADFYPTVKKIAPEHTIMIGDTRDTIMKVTDRSNFFPVDYMDAGIWWWYPFPIRKGGRPGAYEGEEIGQRLELVPPSFLTDAKTTKPIFVVLQSYKKDKGRFPTDTEYRAQPYLAYIHGAKGVFWYTGSYTGGVQREKQEGHYDYLRSVWRELREMEPVFLSPDAKEKVTLETPDPMMSYRIKDTGKGRVLIAGNRFDQTTSTTFLVPGLRASEVNVRYENRKVRAEEGKLHDNFATYAVHIYDLPESPSAK